MPAPEEKPAPPAPADGREKSLEVERIGSLVRQMCITRSNLVLYSFEHAVSRRNLENTLRELSAILEGKERVSLDIHKATMLFEGLPIEERNPMVEKLARDFRNLHVSGITFHRGLSLKELAVFFRLISLAREDLEGAGGAKAILERAGATHIGLNQVRYVRLEEDEKVVSQDARVVEGSPEKTETEKLFLEQLWRALLEQKVDKEWLLEEVRTDPKRAASQIVALLKHYDDLETVGHQEKRQEALQSLMNSVKTLGVRLAERGAGAGEETEDQRTAAQSLLVLEQELKTRSAGLKTSRAATRFIEEITNTVTAFIDNLQADQIIKEYLKDEKGLKRTEQLLRQVIQRDSGQTLIPRLEQLLRDKGLSEKDFESLLNELAPPKKPSPPRPCRKRRPPPEIAEKIERALVKRIESARDREELVSDLSGVLQREVREKLRQSGEEKLKLAGALQRVDSAISAAGFSLVVLDEDGRAVMATGSARRALGKDLEEELEGELREFLAGTGALSEPARAAFLERRTGERREKFARILAALDHPILDESGKVMGLLLRSPEPAES